MGRKRAQSKSDNNNGVLGNNDIEDVRWLCSLPESELDLLIGLKMLVIRRAKKIGNESLVKHFNLKTLRGLSYTMMEYLKEQLKNSSHGPCFPDSSKILQKCKLLQLDVEDSFSSMSSEELLSYVCPDKKKRKVAESDETEAPMKRQKLEDGTSS